MITESHRSSDRFMIVVIIFAGDANRSRLYMPRVWAMLSCQLHGLLELRKKSTTILILDFFAEPIFRDSATSCIRMVANLLRITMVLIICKYNVCISHTCARPNNMKSRRHDHTNAFGHVTTYAPIPGISKYQDWLRRYMCSHVCVHMCMCACVCG